MADVKTIQDWLLRLRPGDTPIFRHTRETLLTRAQKGDSLTSREVAQPLLADPLATLRLIYGANNRTSRHIASEVATVEHALMMQGLQPFLEKVATLPVLESTPAAKDMVALATLYRHLRLAQHAAEAEAEAENEDGDEEGVENGSDDLNEAGADWLTEQGFDPLDR